MKRISAIAFATMLAISATACTQIDSGNLGIEKTMGQVKPDELTPGTYFTLFKTVMEVNGKETAIQLNDLKPKAKENLTMQDFDADIYYQVNHAAAADLLVKYAGDLTESKVGEGDDAKGDGSWIIGRNLVTRHAREAVYAAVAKQPFAEMQNKRAELASDIERTLQQELDAKAGKGAFVITNVVIRNITSDANLEASIRQAAQVEFQTRQREAQIKLAAAEAERRRIEAEGEARANKIISDSLTPQLVQIKLAEMSRDAAVAVAAKPGNTVLMGNGATPLVNVK